MSPVALPSARVAHRTSLLLVVLLGAAPLAGCSRKLEAPGGSAQSASAPPPSEKLSAMVGGTNRAAAPAGSADPLASPSARRVIRKADLQLESDFPESVQSQVTSLAASKGGFVVGAETHETRADDGAYTVDATMEIRVPSAAFESTLTALRGMATRVANEKVTGEDVTEEYVDLESRLRAERAMQAQYLTILKDAKSIPDVLAVQQKLGEVAAEIEHAEGRRRFLENQSDLSTIAIHVFKHVDAPAPPAAEGPGFGQSVKVAAHESLTLAADIVNGLIRATGFLLPFVVIFLAPMYLLFRLRRLRRRGRAPMPPEA